ncbi:MAG: coenzyme F420-0:L-glutamate ligase, partial [Bdellovibrionales bacterium]|nr:coenzyme F420-0:L-glutamate ligase [Oligoflexia bacterium]
MKNESGRELRVIGVKTPLYSQNQNLIDFLVEHLPPPLIIEGVIIAITSKIVSLSEGCTVQRREAEGSEAARAEKRALIEMESDTFLSETLHQVCITVKHGILIPSAGIDESNARDQEYILFPANPYQSAERIGLALRSHFQLKNLGIILTDSHTTPLRNGVTGIGLAHFGFQAVRNLKGKPDLYGRKMKMTQVNVLDALAAAAVYEMGETDDSKPLAVIQANAIEFTDKSSGSEIHIPLEHDLYGHLLVL